MFIRCRRWRRECFAGSPEASGDAIPRSAFPMKGEFAMMKKIGGMVVACAPLSAFAAVPAAVTTAIADVQTDAVTVATAMIGVIAALLVFSYIRKQLH